MAQKKRLEAQRAELQENLDDTIQQHVVDLRIEGMSDLQDKLQENYEDYVRNLQIDVDDAAGLVADSAKNLKASLDSTNTTLQKFVNSFKTDLSFGTLHGTGTGIT